MIWMRKNRVLLLAAAVAVLYWLLESVAEYALEGGSISGQLFPADRDEEWLRFVITALILSFGLYAQRAMAANARAEAKYRSIFDNSVDGIFQSTSEGALVTANPALARMFGYDSPEEMVEAVTDAGSQLYAEEAGRSEFTRLLREEGVVAGYELRGRRKDGGVLWVSVSARAVKDEDGSLLGFEGTIEDVDERKRAEDGLRENEQRFRATFEQAAVGVAQVSLDGEYLRVNEKLCEILGRGREELLSTTFQELTHPEDAGASLGRARSLIAGEVPSYTLEKRYVRKDGSSVWVSLSVSLVRGPEDEPRYMVAVVEDISGRKRAERVAVESRLAERRRIARELHDVVLQDLTDAMYSMQLKQLQLRDAGLGLEVEGPVSSVRDSIQALRSVINDLRAEERHGRSFLELLEATIEAERLKRRGLLVKLEGAESFPRGISGPAAVEVLRIVQEALVNVRRHSGAACAEVLVGADEDFVRAEVRDDGRGFEPETIPGVGLMAMRERAAALGGDLHVRSEPGSGTCVRVAVPRSRFAAETEQRETVKAERE